jgi:hypothetical protein
VVWTKDVEVVLQTVRVQGLLTLRLYFLAQILVVKKNNSKKFN